MVKPKTIEEDNQDDSCEDFYCNECKIKKRIRDDIDDYDEIWIKVKVDCFDNISRKSYYFCSYDCLRQFLIKKGKSWLPN